LRVLATSGPKRSASIPNVPTVQDAGVKGYVVTSWNGVFAPRGTPKEAIDTMGKAMQEVLAMPDVKAAFDKVGVVAQASTPGELMDRLTSDIKKWDDVIAKAGIAKK
jgi:putative tricarboxylic transport membrane protein